MVSPLQEIPPVPSTLPTAPHLPTEPDPPPLLLVDRLLSHCCSSRKLVISTHLCSHSPISQDQETLPKNCYCSPVFLPQAGEGLPVTVSPALGIPLPVSHPDLQHGELSKATNLVKSLPSGEGSVASQCLRVKSKPWVPTGTVLTLHPACTHTSHV